MLRFDEPSHTYTLNGDTVPSVTQVLDRGISSYANVPRHVLDAAKERGNYVHKACELLLWDRLDWDLLDEQFAPYVRAFSKFLTEGGITIELPEERVWHRTLRYAGTVDLIGQFPKRRKTRRCVIDYKTSFRLMPAVGPQLAAYQEAFNSSGDTDPIVDRYALHLRENGTYNLEPYQSPMDMAVFRACLTLHNFTKGHRNERSQAA